MVIIAIMLAVEVEADLVEMEEKQEAHILKDIRMTAHGIHKQSYIKVEAVEEGMGQMEEEDIVMVEVEADLEEMEELEIALRIIILYTEVEVGDTGSQPKEEITLGVEAVIMERAEVIVVEAVDMA